MTDKPNQSEDGLFGPLGGEITSFRPTKRDPSRASIVVGRKVVATLPRVRLAELGIAIGMTWDAPLAERVAQAVAFDKAYRAALRVLERRSISSGDLADKLRRKEHPPAVVEAVVERLREQRLLNDEAYGRALISQQRNRKPAGKQFLRHKLMQKRLPRDLIDRLVEEAEVDYDAVAEARRLAEQRLKSATLRRCDSVTRKRRIWGALARRGFASGTIAEALAGVKGLEETEDPQGL